MNIPISATQLSGNESEYLEDCIQSNWISSIGNYVDKFTTALSEYIEINKLLVTSNGTAAIHLAISSLQLSAGDEVLIPSLTFVGSVNPVLYNGLKPVFVDVDPITWCIDPDDIERKITSKTKAIMAVHLYGNPAPLKELLTICSKHGLYLIEDAAEALGAYYQGRHVGTFGDAGTFSFYGNKVISTGEGGAVILKDEECYRRACLLRDHAMSKTKRYFHVEMGYNYRLTNLQAAVGFAQIQQISSFLRTRKEIFDNYTQLLNSIEEIQLPFSGDVDRKPVNWVFTLLLKKVDRDKCMAFLRENGIDTRPMFYPINSMPFINDNTPLPVTEDISKRGISLPTFVGLTEEQQTYVSEKLIEFIRKN